MYQGVLEEISRSPWEPWESPGGIFGGQYRVPQVTVFCSNALLVPGESPAMIWGESWGLPKTPKGIP